MINNPSELEIAKNKLKTKISNAQNEQNILKEKIIACDNQVFAYRAALDLIEEIKND